MHFWDWPRKLVPQVSTMATWATSQTLKVRLFIFPPSDETSTPAVKSVTLGLLGNAVIYN